MITMSLLFGHLRLATVPVISSVQKLDFIKFSLSSSLVLKRLTVKPASLEGERELMKELLRFRQASVYTEVIYLEP